jgi:hypothetical protein
MTQTKIRYFCIDLRSGEIEPPIFRGIWVEGVFKDADVWKVDGTEWEFSEIMHKWNFFGDSSMSEITNQQAHEVLPVEAFED